MPSIRAFRSNASQIPMSALTGISFSLHISIEWLKNAHSRQAGFHSHRYVSFASFLFPSK